ncbi:MAG: hypothetical protein MZV63_26080 [Marinilabiliales bacterium]|nr:hypothetical protein [Marinilabiliales bacterium]
MIIGAAMEKGERNAEGNAGFDKSEEERNGRTGAKQGDDAEGGGHTVTEKKRASFEQAAGPFGGEIRPDDAHDENDQNQEEGEPWGLRKEELQIVSVKRVPKANPNRPKTIPSAAR